MIIALDGPDGSGKTTVKDLLHDYLSIDKYWPGSKPCVYRVNHPGSTALGGELRRIVKDVKYAPTPMVARLIFAADTLQFEHEYGSLSEAGAYVVCDRYSRITDLVYGAADGLDLQTIANVQDMVGQKLIADYYFVFQLPAQVAWDRKIARQRAQLNFGKMTEAEKCRIEQKGFEHAQKIAAQFNGMHTWHEFGSLEGLTPLELLAVKRARNIIPIDATQSSQGILKSIISHIPKL